MAYTGSEHLLEDVKLTLENDARWYRWCSNRARGDLEAVDATHWRNALRYFYHPAADLDTAQRYFLRRYFKWRYQTDQSAPPPEFSVPPRLSEDARQAYIADHIGRPFTVLPDCLTPPEKPVMASKLTFKTQFLLNGVDITGQNKNDIYTAIAVEEQRLEELRKIKHQPKSLKAEIEAGEAALQALVDHLDAI